MSPTSSIQESCSSSLVQFHIFYSLHLFFLQCLNVELQQQISCENLDFKLWFVFAALVHLVLRFPFPELSTVLSRSSAKIQLLWDYPCSDGVNCANKPHQTTTWTLLDLWKTLLLKLIVFCYEAWEGWDRQGKRKLVDCGDLQEARGVNHGNAGKIKAYGWLHTTWTV